MISSPVSSMANRALGNKYVEAGVVTRMIKEDDSAPLADSECGHKVGLGTPPSAK
jgi:hypothetical protein